VCVAEPLREKVIALRKLQSEPGEGLGPLSCPVISKLQFSSPRKPNERRGHYVGSGFICKGRERGEIFPPAYQFPIPNLIALFGWRTQSALERESLIHRCRRHQSWPECTWEQCWLKNSSSPKNYRTPELQPHQRLQFIIIPKTDRGIVPHRHAVNTNFMYQKN